MGRYGGPYYGRQARGELRRRQYEVLSYVLLATLAATTIVVVVLAFSR